jgi:hypothetical protein
MEAEERVIQGFRGELQKCDLAFGADAGVRVLNAWQRQACAAQQGLGITRALEVLEGTPSHVTLGARR